MIFHQYVSFKPMQRIYNILTIFDQLQDQAWELQMKKKQKPKSRASFPVYNSDAHPCGGKGMVDPPGQEQELGT
jgi:hypothetical protein